MSVATQLFYYLLAYVYEARALKPEVSQKTCHEKWCLGRIPDAGVGRLYQWHDHHRLHFVV